MADDGRRHSYRHEAYGGRSSAEDGDHSGSGAGAGENGDMHLNPHPKPRVLPDDLPTSLDDRRSVPTFSSETEMYDAWQGPHLRIVDFLPFLDYAYLYTSLLPFYWHTSLRRLKGPMKAD
jgi:hypothetical protein